MSTKLIILRGPSGAGKSTIARQLQNIASSDLLIIEQDYYRNTVFGGKADSKDLVPEMAYQNTTTALNAGYDVIVEGIFRKEKYRPMFERLLHEHMGENYIYYLDVDFEETLKRHSSREKSAHFGQDEMRSWYHMAEPLGLDIEERITANSTVEQSVGRIKDAARL